MKENEDFEVTRLLRSMTKLGPRAEQCAKKILKRESCVSCGREVEEMKYFLPIFKRGTVNGTDEDYSGEITCIDCAEPSRLCDNHEFRMCDECGEKGVYHISDLQRHFGVFLCREHWAKTVEAFRMYEL
jgi:hypothetical protein